MSEAIKVFCIHIHTEQITTLFVQFGFGVLFVCLVEILEETELENIKLLNVSALGRRGAVRKDPGEERPPGREGSWAEGHGGPWCPTLRTHGQRRGRGS